MNSRPDLLADLFTDLRAFPLFAPVPDEQLRWLAAHATAETHPASATLYQPGEALDDFLVLFEGRIRLERPSETPDPTTEPFTFTAPAVLGVLPFSRLRESAGFWRLDVPVRLARLSRADLRTLTSTCYELTEVLVHQMTDRARDYTRLTQQTEKMASLGRLSAGLAHELNNPVAAVARTTHSLSDHLRLTPDRFKAIMALQVTAAQTDAVNDVLFRRLHQPLAPRTALQRSRAEDDLTDWLDDHGVPQPTELAETLADFGFEPTDLDVIRAAAGETGAAPVIGWVVSNLVTEKLVREIATASGRIAELVGSMKTFTHLDQGAGRTAVALRGGLESTLMLLQHKVRAKSAQVTLDLPPDLPTVSGWPGELNQVWMNLLDNALDALPETGGQVLVRAELQPASLHDHGFVLTHIQDNGAGIPPAAQARIFEPFFTTKPIGQGTGLGLDIVKGLVKHHNGAIKVASEPGHTVFTVCLPADNEQ